ncbi:MAG: hypothetical protein H6822_18955 [Planctomycetaceae bacterium]|nr:hypothetical protein [Planctomycetaceae bacterium]
MLIALKLQVTFCPESVSEVASGIIVLKNSGFDSEMANWDSTGEGFQDFEIRPT